MTGKSDFSAVCMKYYKKLVGGLFIVGGVFLVMEHLYAFGGFDLEVLGHEWYGLAMIVLGIAMNLKWQQLPGLLKAVHLKDWHGVLDEGERV